MVEASAPVIIRQTPLALDFAFFLKALQAEIERPVVDEEYFFRLLLYGAGNPLAVLGSQDQGLENHKVESSLQESNFVLVFSSWRHPT